jgi:hypothetical protein
MDYHQALRIWVWVFIHLVMVKLCIANKLNHIGSWQKIYLFLIKECPDLEHSQENVYAK